MYRQAALKSFATAAALLPEKLWRAAYCMDDCEKILCEEFRIRAGKCFAANIGGTARKLVQDGREVIVCQEDMQELLARCTDCSVHTYSSSIARGFVPLSHGHRLGVCGEGICNDGGVPIGFREYYSANLRVAHEVQGAAEGALPYVLGGKGAQGTLIISKPGGGKTTLLRDLVRMISNNGTIISLIDERMEIAAFQGGLACFDVGQNTDTISAVPKAVAIDNMVRAMAPQVIALDEITCDYDCESILAASYCGCKFMATAHAENIEELMRRPIYIKLIESHIFERIIQIENIDGGRKYTIFATGECTDAKDIGRNFDNRILRGNRYFDELCNF